MTERAFDPSARLQCKAGICQYLSGISEGTYDLWYRRGIVPGPVPGTSRYDVRAHDLMLDRVQCLGQSGPTKLSALEEWKQARARSA